MVPRIVRALVLVVAAALAGGRAATAQESINFASISGRVADASGAVVPGATVVVRHTGTNAAATAVTAADGRFRFPYLRVGTYEMVVHVDGFMDDARILTLTVGSAFELPVTLKVAGFDANVTVSAEGAVLDAARSQIAGTVSVAEIQTTPLNGRGFLDLALLVPGVSPTNIGSTQLFPETSAIPGTTLSVSSQRNLSNNFIVDGLSANDDAAALSGIPYGTEAIEQFQVITSGGQAELGRALGGYVNVVTKSGTNELHGDVYQYFRDRSLNAANPLSGTRLPMSQAQYGGSLGGPLARNRTFFFANVEQRQLNQSGLVTIAPENAAAINARLSAIGYRGPLVATGVYANPIDTTNLLGKVDHHVNANDQLGVRYSFYTADSQNSRGAGALSAPSASAGLDNIDQSIAFSNTITLSPRTVNETRAQFVTSDLAAPPTDPLGPAVSIAGVASFGTASGSPTGRTNRMYQIVDSVTHQRGSHALRAGVDLLYNDLTITYPRAARGSYTFSSLANFLAGTYNNSGFTQTFGDTVVSQTNPNVGVYAQDEWKLGASVTVNAGIRYDLQMLDTIATDTNNISPRLGVAWAPTAARRTIVRGSAGLFYDRVPLRALANALLSAGNTTDLANLRQISVSLSPAQTGAPVFPNVLAAAVPSLTPVNLTTMDREIENAHSRQAGVEIEQQIGARATVSAGYSYVRGLDLIMSINRNVPTCVASGGNNGCRPNPTYANNSQYSSAGDSTYHGLYLSFVQRPVGWGSYRVSYTLSKSMNNLGEAFFSSPIDPTDLSKDWGRSDDDQRHRLVVNGSVNTPTDAATTLWQQFAYGFRVSGMLQYYSALPLNATSGVTTVQGTAGRPIVDGSFIPRNAAVGSDFFSVNARVSRTFAVGGRARLEAIAEVFNLTNHRNVITRNTNFGPGAYPGNPSPTFGQPTAVGEPRAVQLAARLRF